VSGSAPPPAEPRDGPLAGAHVLVTGLQGFTGRYLGAALRAAGARVSGTGRRDDEDAGVRAIDLRDAAALAAFCAETAPSHVAHLAARPFVGDSDVAAIYAVNVVGTRNLLAGLAALPVPPHAVLLTSSGAVYGTSEGAVFSENAPPVPGNDYAISKLAMEHTARLFMDRLPITIARPFNYTGCGQEPIYLIPKIVDHFRRRAPRIELGNLDVSRDFSDVRAVAAAYVGLLSTGRAGMTVNICAMRETALRDIVALCADLSGHRMDLAVNPAFVRQNEVRRLMGDNGRLRGLLPNWAPIALEDTLDWMLSSNPQE
jgi:nucleoside-diphosphate-sugar epimerase